MQAAAVAAAVPGAPANIAVVADTDPPDRIASGLASRPWLLRGEPLDPRRALCAGLGDAVDHV